MTKKAQTIAMIGASGNVGRCVVHALLKHPPEVVASVMLFNRRELGEDIIPVHDVRIVQHVTETIAGWVGTGPDVRGTFSRGGI